MNKSKTPQRIMAIIMSVAMIFGMTPISAFADDGNPSLGTSGEITAFAAISNEIAAQNVPLGTTEDELNLPETVEATIDGETVQVAATWSAQPDYDGNTAGEYVFTAVVDAEETDVATPSTSGGLTLASGATLPVITVTVAQAGAKNITAFAELADDVRWQRAYALTLNLPATVDATVDGEAAQVAVTWVAEDYDPFVPGLYMFYATPADGYSVASGVDAPKITVVLLSMIQPFMAGNGNSSSPLQITNAAQLAEIAEMTNAGVLETLVLGTTGTVYIQLANDIDLSGYAGGFNDGEGWIPIGTGTNPFKGEFDGDGKIISNLFINSDTNTFNGLFGSVVGGTIKKLGIVDANITASVSNNYVGGVAGYVGGAGADVSNCYVTGNITDADGNGNVGGVVGVIDSNTTTVSSCYSTANVSGTANVGGVVSSNEGTVQNCYSTGNVTGTGANIGGVVGINFGGTVQNCYSTGAVSGATNVGGVVGGNTGTVTNCAALNPSVKASGAPVGRVVGFNSDGTLIANVAFWKILNNAGATVWPNNTADQIDGEDKTASNLTVIAGFPSTLTASPWTYEDGKLPVLENMAGQDNSMPAHIYSANAPFAGGTGAQASPYEIATKEQLARLAELVNAANTSYNAAYYKLTADIDLSAYGKSYNGGKGWTPIGIVVGSTNIPFKGHFDGNGYVVQNLYIKESTTSNYKGLFGFVEDATIENLGVVNADVTGGNYVGGVVGYLKKNSTAATVQNCFVTGTVRGAGNVGGVSGNLNASIVTNCYSTAAVIGIGSTSNNVSYGGVVGNVGGTGASMSYCYSTGAVSGYDSVGGVVGSSSNIGGGTLSNLAALNPSVVATKTSSPAVGRVLGSTFGSAPTLSGLVGFLGMPGSWTSAINGKDGVDKNTNTIKSSIAWTGTDVISWDSSAWSDTDWSILDNNLPVLSYANVDGNFTGQSGTPPAHINDSGIAFAGAGTSASPFQITTAAELARLAELVNAGTSPYADAGVYYKLENDIDLSAYGANFNSGAGWIPIGSGGQPFRGNFNGGDNTISNLYINDSGNINKGLFGVVQNGTIKNVNIVAANITGASTVGGVAAKVITGNSSSAAIDKCSVSGSINGTTEVGGVVGKVDPGTNSSVEITECYSTGTVTCPGLGTGGVVGSVNFGNTGATALVQNCYSTSAVQGTDQVGGVVGLAVFSGGGSGIAITIENCYATGAVKGTAIVGGVVGNISGGNARVTVKNCAALNPSVIGSNVGRVTGSNTSQAILLGNRAFDGLTDGTDTNSWSFKATTGKDGADMSKTDANTATFWSTAANWDTTAWDSTVWTFANNKLPILKNVGGTQNANGDTGWYITSEVSSGPDYTLYYNSADNMMYKDQAYTPAQEVTATDVPGWSGNGTTLTLSGIDFSTSNPTAMVVPAGTTIVVTGANTIASTNDDSTTVISYGLQSAGSITIQGSGTLNVTAGKGFAVSYGIYTKGLTIAGPGIVNANGAVQDSGGSTGVYNVTNPLIMSGGTLNATGGGTTSGTGMYSTSLSMTDGTIYAKGGEYAVSVNTIPTGVDIKGIDGGGNYTIDGQFNSGETNRTVQSDDGVTLIVDAKLTASTGGGGGGGGGGGTGGGGSSSGGSSKQDTPATSKPIISPMDDKSSGTLNTAINSAANATNSNGKTLDVRLKNVSNFTKENAAAILQKAKSLGKKATVSSDVMSEDGKFVEVRVTVDPALITKTVKLDGYIRQSQIQLTESKFKKFFDNKTTVVHLGQEGVFGQTAKIAARVNLSGFDSKNLYFYSYDKKANTYTRIEKSAYRIDANGYLHFETNNGGDIIISSGPLAKK